MNNSQNAFVIMQIGNKELDNVYNDIMIPAIKSARLHPKRIDVDNEGNLLKKEITENIEKADIIIADLTNERPNCYLEVGYAMGLDKYKNLIFTVREDHYFDSPNYKKGGPKIHFDVTGYDIIFWDKNNLDDFKEKLSSKINRRLAIIKPLPKKDEYLTWDKNWLEKQRSYVKEKFDTLSINRHMEILISPINKELNLPQTELLENADFSQIHSFGWPLFIVFKNNPELQPVPKTDGIISEVEDLSVTTNYDFTYFRKNGQIYVAKSLFEEQHYKNSIIPEVRIKRTAELLLYVSRYYSKLNFPRNELIDIEIGYSGLKENYINFAGGGLSRTQQKSMENDCKILRKLSLKDIEEKFPQLVESIVNEVFVLFNFYKVDFNYVKSIVDQFIIESRNARR